MDRRWEWENNINRTTQWLLIIVCYWMYIPNCLFVLTNVCSLKLVQVQATAEVTTCFCPYMINNIMFVDYSVFTSFLTFKSSRAHIACLVQITISWSHDCVTFSWRHSVTWPKATCGCETVMRQTQGQRFLPLALVRRTTAVADLQVIFLTWME